MTSPIQSRAAVTPSHPFAKPDFSGKTIHNTDKDLPRITCVSSEDPGSTDVILPCRSLTTSFQSQTLFTTINAPSMTIARRTNPRLMDNLFVLWAAARSGRNGGCRKDLQIKFQGTNHQIWLITYQERGRISHRSASLPIEYGPTGTTSPTKFVGVRSG
jgi:hypothetical protein